ncbi:MAG: glycosyltransferase [Microbacteriaceae bacterium]|nr:glycosyltransferase [Microbacteriaceae bacterium]
MTKSIALDITAIAEMNFTTGVQRVIRQFVAAHSDEIEFIRYDYDANVWRSVPELGSIVVRERGGIVAQARAAAEKATVGVVHMARRTSPRNLLREVPFARPAYFWLKDFIARNLQSQAVERTYSLRSQPIWEPNPNQTYLMMDIPVKLMHTWAMQDVFATKVMRSIIYVHDLFPLSHRHLFERENIGGVRSLHLEYLDAVSDATDVITNSEFTLSQYLRFLDLLETGTNHTQNRSVVYLPWPHFSARGAKDDSLAKRIFQDASIRVLLIGQLDKRKNFHVVVSAIRELLKNGENARLGILAGYSMMTDNVLQSALDACTPEQRSRISIEGIVSDAELLAIYDAVDVVAVPSLAEGYGLPVVEALSRGKRVLVANSTALPELATKFDHDAVTIIEPFDVQGWADAIRRTNQLPPLPPVKLSPEFPKSWREFGTRIMAKPRRR